MASFTVKTRVYETADGELVLEGDVRARFLKYGEDTELGGAEAEKVAALFKQGEDDNNGGEQPPAPVDDKQAPAEQTKPARKRAARSPRSTSKRAEAKG